MTASRPATTRANLAALLTLLALLCAASMADARPAAGARRGCTFETDQNGNTVIVCPKGQLKL